MRNRVKKMTTKMMKRNSIASPLRRKARLLLPEPKMSQCQKSKSNPKCRMRKMRKKRKTIVSLRRLHRPVQSLHLK